MSLESELSRPQRGPHNKPTETKAQRKRRLAKVHAERVRLRQRLATDDDAVLTFKEWCAVDGFSERQGRRILTGGTGPVVTRISDRRIGISRRNNRAWLESRSR
jgi:hypothetical protein